MLLQVIILQNPMQAVASMKLALEPLEGLGLCLYLWGPAAYSLTITPHEQY